MGPATRRPPAALGAGKSVLLARDPASDTLAVLGTSGHEVRGPLTMGADIGIELTVIVDDDDDAIMPPLMSEDGEDTCSEVDTCSDVGTDSCSDDGAGIWDWMCASDCESIAGEVTSCDSFMAAHTPVSMDVRGHEVMRVSDNAHQIRYYMSDVNLQDNSFSRDIILSSSDGGAPLHSICGCPRMIAMGVSIEGACRCIAESLNGVLVLSNGRPDTVRRVDSQLLPPHGHFRGSYSLVVPAD